MVGYTWKADLQPDLFRLLSVWSYIGGLLPVIISWIWLLKSRCLPVHLSYQTWTTVQVHSNLACLSICPADAVRAMDFLYISAKTPVSYFYLGPVATHWNYQASSLDGIFLHYELVQVHGKRVELPYWCSNFFEIHTLLWIMIHMVPKEPPQRYSMVYHGLKSGGSPPRFHSMIFTMFGWFAEQVSWSQLQTFACWFYQYLLVAS